MWSKGIVDILEEQKRKCAAFKWMHEEDGRYYSDRNKILNIISIVVLSSTATISSVTTTNEIMTKVVQVISPIVLYSTAVLNSLQHFLNYEKKSERHYTSSTRYNMLYNNISRMLALPESERNEVHDYFAWATKEYDNLFVSSDDISSKTMRKFEQIFKPDITIVNDNINQPVNINMNNYTDDNIGQSKETTREDFKYQMERFMINSYS